MAVHTSELEIDLSQEDIVVSQIDVPPKFTHQPQTSGPINKQSSYMVVPDDWGFIGRQGEWVGLDTATLEEIQLIANAGARQGKPFFAAV